MDDIDRFLREDLGKKGDIASDALFATQIVEARINVKEVPYRGWLAGSPAGVSESWGINASVLQRRVCRSEGRHGS